MYGVRGEDIEVEEEFSQFCLDSNHSIKINYINYVYFISLLH